MDRRTAPATLLVAALLAAAILAPLARADNPVPPAAVTGAASGVGQTTATVAGTVDPKGTATTWYVEYGTTTAYGLKTAAQDAGDGTGAAPVTGALSHLTAGTTYHFRITATNAAGTAHGVDHSFTTQRVPTAPIVTTSAANGISATAVTFRGAVDARGLETTASIQWGSTTKYGGATEPQTRAAAFGSKTLSWPVGGFAPYTLVHYRVVATNAKGTVYGKDRTVRTLRSPATITVQELHDGSVPWGQKASLAGLVTGQGLSQIPLRIERWDFPFSGNPLVQSLRAKGDGTYTADVGPIWSTTHLRVATSAKPLVESATVTVVSRVLVSLKAKSKARRTVTFTGRVQPGGTGGHVSLQRRLPSGRWHRVGRAGLTAAGPYASRYTVRVPRPRKGGRFRAVMVPADHGAHGQAPSRTVRVARVGRG